MNYTYLLKCADDTLYCGWTNQLDKRLKAHNEGKGAKYTRGRRPVSLAYYEIFETKEEAIADKTVTDLICYRCNRMLRKKVRWFSVNQKFYFALGICPEHGYLKGKIRMKRSDDGRIYAVKTMKLVDEEGARQISEKKEEAKKKRVEKTKHRKQKTNMKMRGSD